MKLLKSGQGRAPAAPAYAAPDLAVLRERYRTAKNEYDATRGGERNSFTKEERAEAKRRFELAEKAVNAGLAAEKKAKKGKGPEAFAPAPAAAPSHAPVRANAGFETRSAPPAENLAGIGTRYQDFPVFQGPETGPFMETYSRWR